MKLSDLVVGADVKTTVEMIASGMVQAVLVGDLDHALVYAAQLRVKCDNLAYEMRERDEREEMARAELVAERDSLARRVEALERTLADHDPHGPPCEGDGR